MSPTAHPHRLSRLQQVILTWAYHQAGAPGEPVTWHVPTDASMPRSLRPHVSRSLRRLEARGFLHRLGPTFEPFAGRTAYVALAHRGIVIAQTLSPQ